MVNTLYSPYRVGGAEISVEALAGEFKSLGVEVAVLTLGEIDRFDIIDTIPVWQLKIRNIFWPFNKVEVNSLKRAIWHFKDIYNKGYDKKILDLFDVFKPDIVFTNNLGGFSVRVWELAKLKKIKTIHTIRDYYLQCPKTTKFKSGHNCIELCKDCKLLSYIKKKTSRKVDYVIGISDYVLQDHLNQGYFKDVRSKVIYNGFKFNFNHHDFALLNKNEVVFGFIGQINKEKGVELMLESFRKVNNAKKWKLLIAGKQDQKYLRHLKKINNSNNISFLGYINNQEFYKKIDILIVPSLWNEPFGRVVLEAIINNKIVITSKQGGIREIMINNQGFTFNVGGNELTHLIESLIEGRQNLSFNINQEFMDKFNIKNTAMEYYRLFNCV